MTLHQRVPWSRVVAEGVAIVVSILLAFGIQAWWDDRSRSLEQESQLRSLVEEFRATRDRLEASLDWHVRIETAARELGQRITPSPPGPVVVPDSMIAALLAMPTLDLPTADLAYLQDATDLSALADPELRRLLISFARGIQDVVGEEALGAELVRMRLAPELQRHADLSGAWLMLPSMISGEKSGDSESTTAVSSSTALRSMLAEREFHEWGTILGITVAMERVDSILAGLTAYVGGEQQP